MNVLFHKNRFPFAHSQKQWAIDCHFHSRYSDGSAKIEEILEKAKKKNIGVAITDHNEIRGALEAYHNTLGVPVIPGIEVSCKGMIHLLLYFFDIADLKDFFDHYIAPYRRIDPNASLKKMTALKIAKLAKQYHCVVVLAHPYSATHRGIESYIKRQSNANFFAYIDAIEILNGTINAKRNLKAFELAKQFRKGVVGGSDGHTITSLGHVLTITQANTVEEFLDKVKRGDIKIMGKKANMYQRYKMAGIIFYKHINASTSKHRKEIFTTLGLYTVFQRLSIPILFLAGALTYKKIRGKKEHHHS